MKASSWTVRGLLPMASLGALLLLAGGLISWHPIQATHVPIPNMAVDTDIAGNTYTANPSFPADTNNQDNTIAAGAVDACSLLGLPTLGTTANRTVDILISNSLNTIFADIRLILTDANGVTISPDFAEIVSFNATPFSDSTQDTDLDGNPPAASGGTGTDAAQPVGFLNLPVEPSTVGAYAPGSAGGTHRVITFATQPSVIPANTVNAFASAGYLASRNPHVSADHLHNGTEIENGVVAPYVANSPNGATLYRVVIRVKNLATGANGNPFFVRIDLAATVPSVSPGAAVILGNDTNADGDFDDAGEEENNNLPDANLADGGLQVGGVLPGPPCPPALPATATPTATPVPTDTPTVAPTATPTATATPTITPTPCPQCTPTPTATPTGGGTPTATAAPARTATRTPVASPSALPPTGSFGATSTTVMGGLIALAAVGLIIGGATMVYKRRRASD